MEPLSYFISGLINIKGDPSAGGFGNLQNRCVKYTICGSLQSKLAVDMSLKLQEKYYTLPTDFSLVTHIKVVVHRNIKPKEMKMNLICCVIS